MKRLRSLESTVPGIPLLLAAGWLFGASAIDNMVFPPSSGILNVVTDQGVDNTGRTDVTAKLNQILTSNQRNVMIYFPVGTYRVSGMVRGPHSPTFDAAAQIHGPLIVGQSRTRTVIRLADNTWPTDTLTFGTLGKYPHMIDERVVIHTGDCGNTTFQRQLRNITVDIGRNNDGATGVVFIASNSGCMADVDIVSEDGKGCIGLSLSGSENGPLAVHNVRVKGFKRGVYCTVPDVLSISQIVVENATGYGLVNRGICALDSLKTSMRAPAVLNIMGGSLSLLNGYFDGGAPDTAAIYNHGKLFTRNIRSSGYDRVLHCKEYGSGLRPSPEGSFVGEYVSREPVGTFFTPGVSMNLPVKYPPVPAWEQDMTKWTNPATFKTGSNTWTAAFKSALSQTGKTGMVIPWKAYPSYDLTDTLRIGGSIARVIGTTSAIESGQGAIVVGDGTAPVVVLQGIALWSNAVPMIVRTSRTVVLESVYGHVIAEGTGDLFINDLMGDLIVRNQNQRIWVRKLNAEWSDAGTLVRAESGTAWILGFKSENEQNKILCLQRGIVEMFGFLNYNVGAGRTWPPNIPLFDIRDGNFCATGIEQVAHGAESDTFLVSETRNSQTRKFTVSMNPDAYSCMLYTGFDPSKFSPVQSLRTPIATGQHVLSTRIACLPGNLLEISLPLDRPSTVDLRLMNAQGRSMRLAPVARDYSLGTYHCRVDAASFAPGAYWLTIATGSGERVTRPLIIDRR